MSGLHTKDALPSDGSTSVACFITHHLSKSYLIGGPCTDVSGSFLERHKPISAYHRWSTDNRSKNGRTNEFTGVSYECIHNSYITKQPTPASMITHKSHIPGFSSQLAGGSMEEAPLPQQLVTTSITQGGTLKNL